MLRGMTVEQQKQLGHGLASLKGNLQAALAAEAPRLKGGEPAPVPSSAPDHP
jgi:hypothetical protein